MQATIGQPINRVDGVLKVTGAARYAADAPIRNHAHVFILQSTIARGRIRSIDTSAAEKSPGVLAVLTPFNIQKLAPMKMPKFDFAGGGAAPAEMRLPLADDNILYAGQHIAAVVAETLEQAGHAASSIKVDYAPEKPAIRLDDPAAKEVIPKQSFGEDIQITRGRPVDEVLKSPGLVVHKATYTIPPEHHNPMETSATTVAWDGEDRVTVFDATQYVMGTRAFVADAFSIPRENVRVLCPFVGGAFGCKGFQWPHTLLAAAAARVVKRPVKLMLTRPQMFTSCGHRPPTVQELTLAATKEGKLQAIRHVTTMHGSSLGDFVEPAGAASSRYMYAAPSADIRHVVKQVNIATPTFMRAPGECPGMFALESAMDELAHALGLDPVEFRLRNYAEVHPQSNKPWSSNQLRECYKLGAEKFGWARRNAKPRAMKDGSLLVGYGMANATFPAYRFPAAARVRLFADKNGIRVVGASACHDLGTGAYTVLTQTVADAVGMPLETVKFELGDSTLPYGPVAGGSNTTASVSQAIFDAVELLKANLLKLVPNDSPLKNLKPAQLTLADGKLAAKDDPNRSIPLAQLMANTPTVEGLALPPGMNPAAAGNQSGQEAHQQDYAFHSFGCHFVEVRVDEPVGRLRVSRVVSVMDVGRVLNPKTAGSQVIGAVVMGIGMALMEHTTYDERDGVPVNANLADYPVSTNADVPRIEHHFIDKPDPHINKLGCRGVGEIGITGVAAAIANAVYNATGKRLRDLPLTTDKLL
jgi:xanthine dehydrogenase YagR molybdenum-binding subunit